MIPPDGNTPDFPGSPDAPGGSPGNPGGGLTGFFPPLTGYLAKDGKVWLIGMGIVVVMIVCMLILMHREKQKRNRK